MIFYIADTHFGDERVMRLARRPYDSLTEMNEALISNWNNAVSPQDTVYIVGDFAIDDENAQVIERLNGEKHLILGNHDKALTEKALKAFASVNTILTITDNGRSVCLCHYPLMSYENSIYGGYQVFGHIHNNERDIAFELQKQLKNSLNSSADVIAFTPKTLDELMKMKRKLEI